MNNKENVSSDEEQEDIDADLSSYFDDKCNEVKTKFVDIVASSVLVFFIGSYVIYAKAKKIFKRKNKS